MRSLTDAQLVSRTQDGDVGAFNELAGRWESSLYGFVRRTLGDSEDARYYVVNPLADAALRLARTVEASA